MVSLKKKPEVEAQKCILKKCLAVSVKHGGGVLMVWV